MLAATSPVLDLKGASLYAVRVVLASADTPQLVAALDQRLHATHGLFEDHPTVIDAQALSAAPDWLALSAVLNRHHMPIMGIAVPTALADDVRAAGLPVVSLRQAPAPVQPQAAPSATSTTRAAPATVVAEAGTAQPAAPATATPASALAPKASGTLNPPMVVEQMLRSGQRVYARNTDLIVIGLVSTGAEVIADGCIHVYGPLRGKAIAGAQGNESARILTTHFDAELVSIAGVYRVLDTALPENLRQRAAQIHLDQGALRLDPLPG